MCYYLVMISDSINNASVISVAYLLSNVNRVDLPLTPRGDEYSPSLGVLLPNLNELICP